MKTKLKEMHAKLRAKIEGKFNFWKATTILLLFVVIIQAASVSPAAGGAGLLQSIVSLPEVMLAGAGRMISGGSGSKPKVELYVMSQCPYGTQIEDVMKPVIDQLKDAVDFNLYFIASATTDGTGGVNFASLHGQPEVDENIRQLCAKEVNKDKYFDYIICRNKNIRDESWKPCAEEAKIDVTKMSACVEGERGKVLLKDNIKKANELQIGSSPTLIINGAEYQGGRTEKDLLRAMCKEAKGSRACESIPTCFQNSDCDTETMIGVCINPGAKDAKCELKQPVKVLLTVLNDKTCNVCNPTQIITVSKRLFKGLEVKEVDYSTPEGKKMAEDYSITALPAYVFDSVITKAESYARVSGALVEMNGNYLIDPSSSGANYLIGREEKPKAVDLFVMSECPYGITAEDNMKSVLELFKDQIGFKVHFIGEDDGGKPMSMHGQGEVDEDIRQVCAMKYNPDTYFNYILCRNKAFVPCYNEEDPDKCVSEWDKNWKDCTTEAKIDYDAVKTCFEGDEGNKLLLDDFKVAESLGIGSSPTFLFNNRVMVPGAQPSDAIKTSLCELNEDLKGCDVKLQGTATATPSGGCG